MYIKKLITIQDSHENLTRYFAEIRKYEALTKEEERGYIMAFQDVNDYTALEKICKANLKFVVSVAKHYQGNGASLLDLISEGNEGMIEAVNRYDLRQDVKFFSFALWYIRKHMFTRIDLHKRVVQLPANRELLITRIKKELLELENDLQRTPTVEELTVFVNKKNKKNKKPKIKTIVYSQSDILEAITLGGYMKSIHEKLGDDGEGDDLLWEEILPGDKDLEVDQEDRAGSFTSDFNKFLGQLNQMEYDVVCLSSGLNGEITLRNDDIATALGISEKMVASLKTRAMKRLRKMKNIKSLKVYT